MESYTNDNPSITDQEYDKYLREFEELEIGSEFDIELTSDYNDGLSYNEMDGTEVFYSSIMVKGEERIVSMIYVED